METINWEVEYLTPAKVIRYCKKCGLKTEYISSNMFRVNAQQKRLDIWLIYKCKNYKDTWNMTIFTRINIVKISKVLLEKFMNNDLELAKGYGLNTTLLKSNGAEIETPSFEIKGDLIDFRKNFKIKIHDSYGMGLRVDRILRRKLSLTRRKYDLLVSNGYLLLENGQDIYKSKVKDEIMIIYKTFKSEEINSGGYENAEDEDSQR